MHKESVVKTLLKWFNFESVAAPSVINLTIPQIQVYKDSYYAIILFSGQIGIKTAQ